MSKARWINVCAGAWLLVSGGILRAPRAMLANQLFLGAAIFLLAFLAMGVNRFRRLNSALGLWAMISPFVFGYDATAAAFNGMAVGLVVFAVSLWPGQHALRDGHAASR